MVALFLIICYLDKKFIEQFDNILNCTFISIMNNWIGEEIKFIKQGMETIVSKQLGLKQDIYSNNLAVVITINSTE